MSFLTEKTIGDLLVLEHKFFIPSYQRGYRWTEIQIKDLLEDVWAFIKKKTKNDNEWCCLQPVVVKKNNNHFEVLDGQQRLTTIFLILKFLKEFIKSESFEIEYATKNTENSNIKEFLEKIDLKSEKDSIVNIDYFHIFQAYQKIKEWFQTKANKDYPSICREFITPFLKSTKVIWYEVSSEKDAIEIFTRINIGKIPLTNAELIKALFLNSSNFTDSDTEKIRLRQLEIASEWDRMEYSLQNDELWYFITNSKDDPPPTRIEFLFDIIYASAKDKCTEANYRKENSIQSKEDIDKRKLDGNLTFDEKFGTDEYPTFRFFAKKFKARNKDEINTRWKEIKTIFQTIEEWFTDREYYHKIGFLISTDTEIKVLLRNLKDKKKQEFKKLLDVEIAEKVTCDNLEKLEYPKDKLLISKILLLHNIQTMLNNENETTRFPFARYKDKKIGWDIEHIHAIATNVKVEQEDQKSWLKNNFVETDKHKNEELNSQIESIKEKNNQFAEEEEFQKIIEYVLGEEDNKIRNLCLLDMATNRSYKNDSFKNKRNKIIEKEKNGTFIPVCTRNVFMKYYSKVVKDAELWNENNDRPDYLADIKSKVFNFKA